MAMPTGFSETKDWMRETSLTRRRYLFFTEINSVHQPAPPSARTRHLFLAISRESVKILVLRFMIRCRVRRRAQDLSARSPVLARVRHARQHPYRLIRKLQSSFSCTRL